MLAAAQRGKAHGSRASGQLQGLLGTVASLLRVLHALGESNRDRAWWSPPKRLTESWNDASAAIEYLKQQRGGRATFLPLDRLSVLFAIAAPRTHGILGNAVDLVAFDHKVAPAMQLLLNRVWVAGEPGHGPQRAGQFERRRPAHSGYARRRNRAAGRRSLRRQ